MKIKNRINYDHLFWGIISIMAVAFIIILIIWLYKDRKPRNEDIRIYFYYTLPKVSFREGDSIVQKGLAEIWSGFLEEMPYFYPLSGDSRSFISGVKLKYREESVKLKDTVYFRDIEGIYETLRHECKTIILHKISKSPEILKHYKLNGKIHNYVIRPTYIDPSYFPLSATYGAEKVAKIERHSDENIIVNFDSSQVEDLMEDLEGLLANKKMIKVRLHLGATKKVTFEKLNEKGTVIIFAPLSNSSFNKLKAQNKEPKPTSLYAIWFVIANSEEDTNKAAKVAKYIRNFLKKYGDTMEVKSWKYITPYKNSIYEVAISTESTLHSEDSIKYFIADLKIDIPGPNWIHKVDINLQKLGQIKSNSDIADVKVKMVLYDTKLNIGTNIRFMGNLLDLDVPVARDRRKLIEGFVKNLKDEGYYPVAIQRIYMVSNDTLARRKVDLNMFQGVTGLWWSCQ